MIRLTGKAKPQFLMAARTRSRASFTAASGRPTTVKAGSPPDRSPSAETSYPVTPCSPRDRTLHTTVFPPDLFFLIVSSFPAGCNGPGERRQVFPGQDPMAGPVSAHYTYSYFVMTS